MGHLSTRTKNGALPHFLFYARMPGGALHVPRARARANPPTPLLLLDKK